MCALVVGNELLMVEDNAQNNDIVFAHIGEVSRIDLCLQYFSLSKRKCQFLEAITVNVYYIIGEEQFASEDVISEAVNTIRMNPPLASLILYSYILNEVPKLSLLFYKKNMHLSNFDRIHLLLLYMDGRLLFYHPKSIHNFNHV